MVLAASIPRQLFACMLLVLCFANATQMIATIRNWRSREKLIRANSTLIRASHICFTVTLFFSALSSILASLNPLGTIGALAFLAHSLAAFAMQTWMMIVGHETIRSGYQVAMHPMPACVRNLLLCCWLSWWVIHPVAFIAGVVSDNGLFYAVPQIHNVCLFSIMLGVLAWSARTLLMRLADYSSQQEKAHIKCRGQDLRQGVRGHVRRVMLMCATCSLLIAYYLIALLVVVASGIPYIRRENHSLVWELVTFARYGLQIGFYAAFTYLYWVKIDRRGPQKGNSYVSKSSPMSSTVSGRSTQNSNRSSPVPSGVLSLTQINNILLPDSTRNSAGTASGSRQSSSPLGSASGSPRASVAAKFVHSSPRGSPHRLSLPGGLVTPLSLQGTRAIVPAQ